MLFALTFDSRICLSGVLKSDFKKSIIGDICKEADAVFSIFLTKYLHELKLKEHTVCRSTIGCMQ